MGAFFGKRRGATKGTLSEGPLLWEAAAAAA